MINTSHTHSMAGLIKPIPIPIPSAFQFLCLEDSLSLFQDEVATDTVSNGVRIQMIANEPAHECDTRWPDRKLSCCSQKGWGSGWAEFFTVEGVIRGWACYGYNRSDPIRYDAMRSDPVRIQNGMVWYVDRERENQPNDQPNGQKIRQIMVL